MPDTKLDRDVQRKILAHLSGLYPQTENRLDMAFSEVAEEVLGANLQYLEDHRLAKVQWFNGMKDRQAASATLTAKGADFLAEDGGLSSILNVVTVRLHEDTLKAKGDASFFPPSCGTVAGAGAVKTHYDEGARGSAPPGPGASAPPARAT